MSRDRVFHDPQAQIVDFVFDERVVAVFPDMIRRSVPGYETVVPLTGLLAARYARPGTRCYDLGCSLGATSLAIARQLDRAGVADCPVIGVDNSPAMLAEANRQLHDVARLRWIEADVLDLDFEPCSVVVMNYTLQFVPPDARTALLRRIHDALVPEGVLLLSEKTRFADDELQATFSELHLDFKRANGYSELEISRKRQALENVMVPDTAETHHARLDAAGFRCSAQWFGCLNWASFNACR
jgi:tRNA (cmo5U34)-methyltransferase